MTTPSLDKLNDEAPPPRNNGELVFEEPWQSRAFGIAVSAAEAGRYDWEDFRCELIATISAAEAGEADTVASGYYQQWLASLERTLLTAGVVTAQELDERQASLAEADAHEHDH